MSAESKNPNTIVQTLMRLPKVNKLKLLLICKLNAEFGFVRLSYALMLYTCSCLVCEIRLFVGFKKVLEK